MMNKKRLLTMAVSAALAAPMSAFATNGMNLEGYGPEATAMGGASMAYDNGAAAMMNNPATLSLMADGESRLDIALGELRPSVKTSTLQNGGMSAKSGGDSYMMPAAGWVKRSGQISYGVGVFSQGGMGTEYSRNSFMGVGTGQDARSELGVGRLMFPVSFKVNDQFTVGGSVDYVWGGLDMKMVMPAGDTTCASGAQPDTFADFLCPSMASGHILGEADISGFGTGGLGDQMAGALGAGYDTIGINFSDSNDFTQEADGAGFAGKIGMTFRANDQLSFGATYHLKTAMSDWKGSAAMVFYDTDGAMPDNAMDGKIAVKNFQWPATIAAGMAFTPNDRLLLVTDVKILQWSDVMSDFTMVFTPDGMPGEEAEFKIYQDWKDQTVFSLGGAYKVNNQFTVRAGANLSNNPVPDKYVHPLFPAIIKNHYTAGFGYAFSDASAVNFSVAHAPKVTVTNSNTQTKISHAQTNWQMMYSHRF